jgi:hypothetical protein
MANNNPSTRYHLFPKFQAAISAFLVYGCAKGWVSDIVTVSVIGGALGAALHILDALLDHRTQRVRSDAQETPTSAAFQYLIGRSILGGVSGYIAYNFAGVWHWFDAAALANYGNVLSLAILAGFSTTTLSVLSGRIFGKDAHGNGQGSGSKGREALSPPVPAHGAHDGAAHDEGGNSTGAAKQKHGTGPAAPVPALADQQPTNS